MPDPSRRRRGVRGPSPSVRRRRRGPSRRRSARFRGPNPYGATGRVAILLALAALAGIALGLGLPWLSPVVGKAVGEYSAVGPAADALGALPVDDRPDARGYDRDAFAFRQVDADGNGCDTRDDILARDLTGVRRAADRCTVLSGTLDDPYTGRTIPFRRGRSTSAAVQIDHVVALENAWQSGARDWSASKRHRFANDPYNLLAVDGPSNQEKGAASAAYWLPTNGDYRCGYVARQIGVKDKYGLSVTTAERDAMRAVLRSCPSQKVPADTGGVRP